jgi:endonuclease/exonuclease/phosphatase family metal-dependent hydrolase
MQRLRILTFNIAHGRGLTPIQGFTLPRKLRANLRKIARLIERIAPDIVALQEIDEHSRWAGNFDQLEYLRLHTGYRYSVYGINNRREGLLNLCYGNAILSRHPIIESENIVFGEGRLGEKRFSLYRVGCRWGPTAGDESPPALPLTAAPVPAGRKGNGLHHT